jgi:hypothetical protein
MDGNRRVGDHWMLPREKGSQLYLNGVLRAAAVGRGKVKDCPRAVASPCRARNIVRMTGVLFAAQS